MQDNHTCRVRTLHTLLPVPQSLVALAQLILEGEVCNHYEAQLFPGGLSSEVLCSRNIGALLQQPGPVSL